MQKLGIGVLPEESVEEGNSIASGPLTLKRKICIKKKFLSPFFILSMIKIQILTVTTGEAMSTCNQTPGKSKPKWALMNRPAQED